MRVSVKAFEIEEAVEVIKKLRRGILVAADADKVANAYVTMKDILNQCSSRKKLPCYTCAHSAENNVTGVLCREVGCLDFLKWTPAVFQGLKGKYPHTEKLTTCGCPQCEEKMRIYLDHIEEMLEGPKTCPHSSKIPTIIDGRLVL